MSQQRIIKGEGFNPEQTLKSILRQCKRGSHLSFGFLARRDYTRTIKEPKTILLS